MARKVGRHVGKLSPRFVQTVKAAGLYGDGGGLYLKVGDGGAKSWIIRWSSGGKVRKRGLGPTHTVSLAQARQSAAEARGMIRDHIDPRDARRAAALAAARMIDFDTAAALYIEAHQARWKNAKHVKQWATSLATYASPVFGKLPVSSVDVGMVMKVLTPIWTSKNATAFRVRGRLEAVLAWAEVNEYRDGKNPAVWRNNLDKILPPPTKVRKTVHHPAMPYAQVPGFMAELRRRQDVASRALEFLILVAGRTGEVLGALWDEIDLTARQWTVPGERMKVGVKHIVPLSDRAVAIVEEMKAIRRNDFVFPGAHRGKGLGSMALLVLLQRMEHDNITVHGFRSSFRDWCTERDKVREVVAEAALAHGAKDETDAAYRRATYLNERVELMRRWADYCDIPVSSGNVVSLR